MVSVVYYESALGLGHFGLNLTFLQGIIWSMFDFAQYFYSILFIHLLLGHVV